MWLFSLDKKEPMTRHCEYATTTRVPPPMPICTEEQFVANVHSMEEQKHFTWVLTKEQRGSTYP